jgi:hypothetical protein
MDDLDLTLEPVVDIRASLDYRAGASIQHRKNGVENRCRCRNPGDCEDHGGDCRVNLTASYGPAKIASWKPLWATARLRRSDSGFAGIDHESAE